MRAADMARLSKFLARKDKPPRAGKGHVRGALAVKGGGATMDRAQAAMRDAR
jgi:hypothetical protein